jgi:3-isopropylmalate dehydrogenase
MPRTIAVIPGDGIGPAVIDSALRVIEALRPDLCLDVMDHVNSRTYRSEGAALSLADLARIRSSDAVLLGAIGDAALNETDYVRSVLLRLRMDFDLYACCRPARLWHDSLSPLRDPAVRQIDCVIVRENTEGIYSGIGGALRVTSPWGLTIDADVNTHHGVSRIIDFAFSVARDKVCMVDKANAVRSGGRLWQDCWEAAVERHPGFSASHLYVDAAAMKLLTDPTAFDVIVTNNSYGDILSDLTAALAGGIGLAASANVNPASGFGLFEPVHGTAPDIADRGTANPLAAIHAAGLLLGHLGYPAEAEAVQRAIAEVIKEGRVTIDIGGALGTTETAAAVVAAL